MSQVFFHAEHRGQTVEVMAGWDHPLQYFFLTIFDARGQVLYSNLRHPSPPDVGRDTSTFRWVLSERGITPPDGFWERVEQREGNVTHRYTEGAWS